MQYTTTNITVFTNAGKFQFSSFTSGWPSQGAVHWTPRKTNRLFFSKSVQFVGFNPGWVMYSRKKKCYICSKSLIGRCQLPAPRQFSGLDTFPPFEFQAWSQNIHLQKKIFSINNSIISSCCLAQQRTLESVTPWLPPYTRIDDTRVIVALGADHWQHRGLLSSVPAPS